jgi:hypothetical protein
MKSLSLHQILAPSTLPRKTSPSSEIKFRLKKRKECKKLSEQATQTDPEVASQTDFSASMFDRLKAEL